MVEMEQQQNIDQLLEHYLGLLDEYTSLRQNLSQLQTAVYQGIARANFVGERGMRYGQDHYDERMQAIRRLDIRMDGEQQHTFTIADAPADRLEEVEAQTSEGSDEEEDQSGESEDNNEAAPKKHTQNKDPLHWFGLFTPMPLRTAQTQSIQAVEEVIPKIVSINAEMLTVEIEIRRARKRMAKAKTTAEKKGGPTANVTEPQSQASLMRSS